MGTMIVELQPVAYKQVQSLCQELAGHHPILEGILREINRGKVYVDDARVPQTALIWAQNEIYFLLGLDPYHVFEHDLPRLLTETIRPEALQLGDDFFQVELMPAAVWEPKIEGILAQFLLKPYDRVAFSFSPELYLQLPDWHTHIPADVQIVRIDAELLTWDQAHGELLSREVLNFWYSLEDFLEYGVGYCALEGDELRSCCLSVFAGLHDIEVGINTYARKYRGLGFGTLTARALLDDCIHRGVTPHWKTEAFRYASIRLAEKLGFTQKRQYKAYCYSFDEQTKVIITAVFCLREAKDRAEAEELIARARQYGPLSPNHEFMLACGFATTNDTEKACQHLEAAIAKGWRNTADVRFENDLRALYTSDDWNALLERLEGSSREHL